MRKIRKFDTIEKECEWCHNKFEVTWKYKKQRFCCKQCMYDWRKNENWEELECLECGKKFKSRKNDRNWVSGEKRMFCSQKCNLSSEYRKDKLRDWIKNNNPMHNGISPSNISKTKLKKYGDKNYNNPKQQKQTLFDRYGVNVSFFRKSNGLRITSIQKIVYNYIKSIYDSALLEETLADVLISVDIYIPDKKIVIETDGDYWHMNPKIYKKDFYNKSTHKTAKETWQYDKKRRKVLTDAGYKVIALWETDIKNGNYFKILKENKV